MRSHLVTGCFVPLKSLAVCSLSSRTQVMLFIIHLALRRIRDKPLSAKGLLEVREPVHSAVCDLHNFHPCFRISEEAGAWHLFMDKCDVIEVAEFVNKSLTSVMKAPTGTSSLARMN